MSRHIVKATSLDDTRTVWIQPDPDPKSDPGWRLRFEWMCHDNAYFVEEQTLPERVDNPNANRTICKAHIELTHANARWLRDALTEFLAEDAALTPTPPTKRGER